MPKLLRRADNRPILIRSVNLWWYVLVLAPILALGWLVLSNFIPAVFLPVVLFALIFWVSSFVMAIIARLRGPRPEPRQ